MADPKIRYDILATASGAPEVDQLAEALESLDGELEGLSNDRAAELAQSLRELANLQRSVQGLKELEAAIGSTEQQSRDASAQLKRLQDAISTAGAPTRQQATELSRLQGEVNRLTSTLNGQRAALDRSQAGLRALGIDANNLGQAQRLVRTRLEETVPEARALAARYRDAGAAAKASGADQVKAATDSKRAAQDLNATLGSIKTVALGTLLGGGVSQLIGDVASISDQFANLQARVRLVTGEGAAFEQAWSGIAAIAERTNSSLEATAELFGKVALAGREVGLSQQQALDLTEAINQAVQLSGSAAGTSEAAIRQLVQGLQSGVVRGDEFNSVMENSPRLARALADGLGVTTGELRKLADQGKLTAATVIEAIRSQAGTLRSEFETLPPTIGRALQNISTQWALLVGSLSNDSGAAAAVAAGLNAIAQNLDTVARLAAVAGTAVTAQLAVKGAQALRVFRAEALAAAGTSSLLAANLSKVPPVLNIAVAAVGFEAAFSLGETLRENSELARKLGVGITAFIKNVLNDLQLLAEAGQAIFTDDEIGAAFDRYRARGRELDAIFGELWQEAERAPSAIRDAADKAAEATGMVGVAGEQAGQRVAQGADGASAGLKSVGGNALTAEDALRSLADAGGVKLRGLGVDAAATAQGIAELATRSSEVAAKVGADLPKAIEKLSGPELARFRVEFERAFREGSGNAELLEDGLAQIGRRALQSLGVDVPSVARTASEAFRSSTDDLNEVVHSLEELRRTGIDTGQALGQALGKMIDGAKNAQEFEAVRSRILALRDAQEITADSARELLQSIAIKARAAAEETSALGDAARKAGIDFGSLTSGISSEFAGAVQQVSDLAEEVQRAGVSAERAGPLLAGALDQRLSAARTREEVAELQRVIDRMIAASPQLAESLGGVLDAIRAKAEQLSPEMQRLNEAAKRLGVTLGQDVPKSLESGIRAYEAFKASGKASADEVRQAFINMAREAVAAAGGVVPDWIKVEASLRGVALQSVETGQAITSGMDAAGDSVRRVSREVRALQGELQQAAARIDGLAARNDDVRSNIGTGKAGPAVDNSGLFSLQQKLAEGTLSAADLPTAQAVFDAARSNLTQAQARPGALSEDGWRSVLESFNSARSILERIKGAGLAVEDTAASMATLASDAQRAADISADSAAAARDRATRVRDAGGSQAQIDAAEAAARRAEQAAQQAQTIAAAAQEAANKAKNTPAPTPGGLRVSRVVQLDLNLGEGVRAPAYMDEEIAQAFLRQLEIGRRSAGRG